MPAGDVTIPDDATLKALTDELGRALLASGARLAVAESCTGGWLAKAMTDNAGSGDWFEAGIVSYSNAAKASLLGVSPDLIESDGAVSEPVVRAMAVGARLKTGADAAIAVSGIAGPSGGSPEKPVGLVWFGWSLGDRDWARHRRFDGDREAVRRQSVAFAVQVLLDELPVDRR